MNDLNRALSDITSIRRQMAAAAEFRGYGPAALASTAALAIAAALLQPRIVPDPVHHLRTYLFLWLATAILSATLMAVEMVRRAHRIHTHLANEMLRQAVEQFLPAAFAGAVLTVVIVKAAPASAWMLPGLWQIIFSLGIFASCRFLPRPIAAAGLWYLVTGLTAIGLGDTRALGPWIMAIPYAIGQLLVAAILYLNARESADEA
ncbi:MAG: hypothetical protein V4555_10850 [Acidobacteriota bacterium]